MQAKDLITNSDGRVSTTTTIQFFGFIILAGTLLWSVYLDRDSATELYQWFAIYCGGLTASKGAITAYRAKKKE